jgi:hypothetical protein
VELVTVPTRVLEEWAAKSFPMPDQSFAYSEVDAAGNLKPTPYRNINLNQRWNAFDLRQFLTAKGIGKFGEDFESTIRLSASTR